MIVSAPPMMLKDRVLQTSLPAFVMTIVNCTPDSFFQDSRFLYHNKNDLQKVTEYVLQQFEKGANIVDIGGESSRPGAQYITAEQEMERVLPLISEIRKHSKAAISIDTRKSTVLKEALMAGADILNDISALEDDDEIVKIAAREKIPVILMHKRDIPLTMQQNTVYNDIVEDVCDFLLKRVMHAVQSGIENSKIILDAGIGFAKSTVDNISLIRSSYMLEEKINVLSGVNVYGTLVGLSRKTCIGDIIGKPIEQRQAGTVSANMLAVQHGAKMLRVHDTEETVDMLKILQEIG